MKMIDQPCETVCFFDKDGNIRPQRIRITDNNGEQQVIIITEAFEKYEGKVEGVECIIYKCQSNFENEVKVFELKFNKNEMKWLLFKM